MAFSSWSRLSRHSSNSVGQGRSGSAHSSSAFHGGIGVPCTAPRMRSFQRRRCWRRAVGECPPGVIVKEALFGPTLASSSASDGPYQAFSKVAARYSAASTCVSFMEVECSICISGSMVTTPQRSPTNWRSTLRWGLQSGGFGSTTLRFGFEGSRRDAGVSLECPIECRFRLIAKGMSHFRYCHAPFG